MANGIIWSPGMTIEMMERLIILEAYRFYRQNKTATANSLGIAIRTLDNKLAQYELEDQVQKEKETELAKQRKDFLARSRGSGLVPDNVGFQNSAPAPGIRMESVINASSQHALPVHEHKEVQDVLLPQGSQNGNKKGRGSI